MNEKLNKILQLAERGICGEKENAQRMLNAMLKKHGLTLDDIRDDAEEKILHYFKYKNSFQAKLLAQIITTVADDRGIATYSNKGIRKATGAYLTYAQRLEVELLFNIYSKSWEDELNIFYRAFIQKHSIFPPSDKPIEKKLSLEEKQRIKKIFDMMEGIDRVHVRRALENKI